MAPTKPKIKSQSVTPCSSPTAMAAKTVKVTGTNAKSSQSLQSPQKSPKKGVTAEIQTGRDEECTPSGKDILEAIRASSEILSSKIDSLAVDVCSIKHEFDKIQKKTAEIEMRVFKVEEELKKDNKGWHTLKKQIKELQDRAIETESRLRRNNVRILGLPERAEGDNPVKFAEKLLTEVLKLTEATIMFVVERAH